MADESQTTETSERPPMAEIARGLFGDNFKGEVPEKPEEKAESEETEETEVEAEAETEETEETEESEEEPISSLDDLIQHYEWDPEWAKSINVQAKVFGEVKNVPLKDLIDNYQMYEAADKRLEEAKSKVQTQNQEFEKKVESLQQHFAQAGKLIENAEQLLDQDSKAIDWKQLREDDPAEYSAKKAEIAERRQEIDRMKHEAVDAYNQAISSRQYSQEDYKKYLQAENEKLLSAIPDWKEPDRAQEEKSKVAKYLIGQGFTEHDVQAASDHRLIVLAHKARLYDEGRQKTSAAKKKVAKVPKMAKPGAARNQDQQASKQQAQKAKQRLRETGSLDDAFGVLRATRGGK